MSLTLLLAQAGGGSSGFGGGGGGGSSFGGGGSGSGEGDPIVDVELGGRRYVEDRDTAAVLSGSSDAAATFTERWTVALGGPDDSPWRLVEAA